MRDSKELQRRRANCKLWVDFLLCGESAPLTLMLFKGQMCVCVCVCVCVYTYMYVFMFFKIGIGSLRVIEVEKSQSGVCNQENQESQWYNLVSAWRLENEELWCLRTGKEECSSPRTERMNSPFLSLFVPFAPQWMDEGGFFSQSSESNANLFKKYPHRHT